jgi:hypothetical protein
MSAPPVASVSPETDAATPSAADASLRHGPISAVVCLALAAVVVATSSLNVALADIARATHASQVQLTWVIDAYSLVFAFAAAGRRRR